MNQPKVIIVTGGSRGIGRGIAKALAAAGATVVITGRRDSADDAVAEIGGGCVYVRADVADPEARQNLVDRVVDRFGRVDGLVNNAGIAPDVRADILQADEASFERLMRVNTIGPYFLTQLVARQMRTQFRTDRNFRGSVVFVTSVSSVVASVNRGDYCVSKAAGSMSAKLWAARLAEFGVGVYEVRPGVIRTDMTAGVTDKYDKLFADGLAVEGRWGTPEDVASVVRPMAMGEFTYATGSVVYVDGGLTLQRM